MILLSHEVESTLMGIQSFVHLGHSKLHWHKRSCIFLICSMKDLCRPMNYSTLRYNIKKLVCNKTNEWDIHTLRITSLSDSFSNLVQFDMDKCFIDQVGMRSKLPCEIYREPRISSSFKFSAPFVNNSIVQSVLPSSIELVIIKLSWNGILNSWRKGKPGIGGVAALQTVGVKFIFAARNIRIRGQLFWSLSIATEVDRPPSDATFDISNTSSW